MDRRPLASAKYATFGTKVCCQRGDLATTIRGMQRIVCSRAVRAFSTALFVTAILASTAVATHGGTHVTLEPDTKGCTGVLPSTNGNTDMRVVGGTMEPGGTAVFEITYPLNASSVGKEFTITACAFINDVATLKYLVSFVPSNQSFVLQMTFAVPDDAPVGGMYCNYAKTTRSPTAAQASQRKAGPACFVIRPPRTTSTVPPPTGGSSNPPQVGDPSSPPAPDDDSSVSAPALLPDTAMRSDPPDRGAWEDQDSCRFAGTPLRR
jgi:hypothetical protein